MRHLIRPFSLVCLATLAAVTAQAEPLIKRALAVWQKTLGAEHPNVATALEN